MRNERIRTYNFPQGRVTDHRIGLTLYKIESVMDGDLDELMDALAAADQGGAAEADPVNDDERIGRDRHGFLYSLYRPCPRGRAWRTWWAS